MKKLNNFKYIVEKDNKLFIANYVYDVFIFSNNVDTTKKFKNEL